MYFSFRDNGGCFLLVVIEVLTQSIKYCSYVGPDSLTRVYDLNYYPGKVTYLLAVGMI